ncbi:MAG TPA: hypothetical protein VK614_02290 [Allosphingosinicella sp.]|nr:hypothetical protein [Allosphingosinicella sp.]
MTAIVTGDKATQREIRRDIDARGRAHIASKPLLNPVVGIEVNQGLVLCLAQTNVPARNLQIARVERLCQKPKNALIHHDTVAASRELGMRF